MVLSQYHKSSAYMDSGSTDNYFKNNDINILNVTKDINPTTIKNVLRNHEINGNDHVNVTKSVKPKNQGLDPDAICALHPTAKHSNKQCFTQINAKAAAKEKRDKPKSSKLRQMCRKKPNLRILIDGYEIMINVYFMM